MITAFIPARGGSKGIFGKNIKEGKKVKQGQIIGYVGSTGMSTGPHLHYVVIENRKKIFSFYMKHLNKKKFEMQLITKNTNFVPWTVSIKINNNFTQKKRNNIMSLLGKMGIETRNGFYSPYELPIFSKKKGLPVSLMLSRRIISLPLYEGLSELKVKYICSALNKVSK